jgi:polyisoprenoid-binding protein YceI
MGSAAAGSAAAGSAAADAPAADADYFQVLAHHEPGKPTDPVKVSFDKFKVTKAQFDPAKLDGATATLEVDLTSLHTGSNQRDAHLGSESYLDSAKFATLTIDVSNVKSTDATHFTADAKVALHGAEKTYPVTFEVLDRGDDWVRVRGEHEISRLDFSVGKPDNGPDELVAKDMKVQLQLTLHKS